MNSVNETRAKTSTQFWSNHLQTRPKKWPEEIADWLNAVRAALAPENVDRIECDRNWREERGDRPNATINPEIMNKQYG